MFNAVAPERVFDTRPGESPNALRSVDKRQVAGDYVLEVQMSDLGSGLVPRSGVAAVSLNVAVTNTGGAGFITVFPCGPRTLVASVNYERSQTVANAVIAPVSATGTVCFYSSAPADLVVDLNGWYAISPGFTPISPSRVFDTRPGESPNALLVVQKSPVSGDPALEVRMAAPGSGVSAVSLNVAVTNTSAGGYVTVYTCGERKLVASVNYARGQTVANAVIAPVSAAGTVCFYSPVPVDLVVDLNGSFSTGPGFTPLPPDRVFDTRAGQSPSALPHGPEGSGRRVEPARGQDDRASPAFRPRGSAPCR